MLNIHTFQEIGEFGYNCFKEIAAEVGGTQTGTIDLPESIAITTRLPLGDMWLGFRKIVSNHPQYYVLLAQHAEDIFISLEDDGAKDWVKERKSD
jgi:hypothetical protein